MKTVNRPSQSNMEYITVTDRRTGKKTKALNKAYQGGKQKRRNKGAIGVTGDFVMDSLQNDHRFPGFRDEVQRAMEVALDAVQGHSPLWYHKNSREIVHSMHILKHNPMSDSPEPEGEQIPGSTILSNPHRQRSESDIGLRSSIKGYRFGANSDSITDIPNAVYSSGRVEYRDSNGKLHHPDGPAVVEPSGEQLFYNRGVKERSVSARGVEKHYNADGDLTGIIDPNNKNAWDEYVAEEKRKNDELHRMHVETRRRVNEMRAADERHRKELESQIDSDGYAEVDVWYKNGKPAGYGDIIEGTNGFGSRSVSVKNTNPNWGNLWLSAAKNPETAARNNAKKGIEKRREKVRAMVHDLGERNPQTAREYARVYTSIKSVEDVDKEFESRESGRYSMRYDFSDIKQD